MMDISDLTGRIAVNVPLAAYSTMRLGGSAAYMVEVSTADEVAAAYTWAANRGLPYLVIGSGSNVIWRDEGFAGLIILNKLKGFSLEHLADGGINFRIAAGENWDGAVARSVEAHLSGIEALSLVPGTAGATPVQNVGAYGQDISQTLVDVEAYDTTSRAFVTIPAAECGFGYRTSRFKREDRGRFIITAITLRLSEQRMLPPFYSALQKYFDEHGIADSSPDAIRQAVIDIRSSKLPNPNLVANNGSFFANPIISATTYAHLAAKHGEMQHWPAAPVDGTEMVKLSAAWLIDQAGFKDYNDEATGMATWATQPLVLVNINAKSTADLLAFRQRITDAVQQKFGVVLTQEPELLPDA